MVSAVSSDVNESTVEYTDPEPSVAASKVKSVMGLHKPREKYATRTGVYGVCDIEAADEIMFKHRAL